MDMMKVKQLIPCVLAMLAVLLLSGCGEKENPTRTSLESDTSTLTLFVGESAFRAATTKAEHYRITYTSSNPAVATVDRMGKVTGVSEGDAVITIDMAESIEDWYAPKKLTYNVVVVKKPVSDETTAAVPAPVPAPPPAPAPVVDLGVALNSASVTVGMIIAENGKAYAPSNYDASFGKKVAIVAYKGAAGSADTSTGSSGYCGLAIALNDANGGAPCQWGPKGAVCNTNAMSSTYSEVLVTTGDFCKGIDNTNRLANADCFSGHDHAAAKAAKNYKYDASVSEGAHPTGTSQWFLPTMYQWNLILKGVCGDHGDLRMSTAMDTGINDNYKTASFDTKITAAGGTSVQNLFFWPSIEKDIDASWGVDFVNGRASYYTKIGNMAYVRAVLAF